MPETIIKILQKLKEIGPDNDFSKRSLPLILSAAQNRSDPLKNFFRVFQFSGALVLASILIFIVFGGLTPPDQLTSLDVENIRQELNDLDLKIKLAEIKYAESPLDQTSVALNDSEAKNKAVDDLLKELSL